MVGCDREVRRSKYKKLKNEIIGISINICTIYIGNKKLSLVQVFVEVFAATCKPPKNSAKIYLVSVVPVYHLLCPNHVLLEST